MKGEPLKDKLKPDMSLESPEACGFTREDVKSAVEFLIDRIENYTLIKNNYLKKQVVKDIEEAFEDVIEE